MTVHHQTATCHTGGCANADEAIPFSWDDADDMPAPSVTCGVCAQPITDVQDAPAGLEDAP